MCVSIVVIPHFGGFDADLPHLVKYGQIGFDLT
jgi:hypothetical protein